MKTFDEIFSTVKPHMIDGLAGEELRFKNEDALEFIVRFANGKDFRGASKASKFDKEQPHLAKDAAVKEAKELAYRAAYKSLKIKEA